MFDVLVQLLALRGLLAIINSTLSSLFHHLSSHRGTIVYRGHRVAGSGGVEGLIMPST